MLRLHIGRTLLGLAIGYLLYRSVLLCIPVGILFIAYSLLDGKSAKQRYMMSMETRFRNFLICLEPLLGTSENFSTAYAKAVEDYGRMHGSDNLLPILISGTARFRVNSMAGDVVRHIAEKTKLEDAWLFAGSLEGSEETGSNVVEITGHTLGIITEKIQLKNELVTMLSGRRFEHMIVSIMPAVILVLLTAGAESYMEPLYETVAGRLVMTAAGAIFGLSWYTGKKITSLEV
ncbi:MAG TPA: hypothetical protein PLP30_06865 [Clostridia bacterium]|nr:hypothetical protein [Clostridia bacterium]HPQ47069.1 hypothetical protein [Clostridia bacterium]HRX41299.1 hypothetical protein [Clostridia bacterium]